MCSWGLGVHVKRDVESYIQGTRGCKKKKLKGPRFLWIHSISKEVQERKSGGLSWYILHEFLMDTWYTLHSIYRFLNDQRSMGCNNLWEVLIMGWWLFIVLYGFASFEHSCIMYNTWLVNQRMHLSVQVLLW